MNKQYLLRQKVGALVYDFLPFLLKMRPQWCHSNSKLPWIEIRNRNEYLLAEPNGLGVHCNWEWTSELHLANVFPTTGLALMRKALNAWPIVLKDHVERKDQVDISFIIGHRGMQRLPHLLMTLQSIAGQVEISFECIVIEQSLKPEIAEFLPEWVHCVHTPLPHADMLYSRSWTFNVGARLARGKILVLHDNDMLVPSDYGAQIHLRMRNDYDVVNLKRFIFYLSEEHTSRILNKGSLILDRPPEKVIQNLQGGGSFGINKEVYFELGGFDEEFVGWGGEDLEFWQRALLRRVYSFTSMPIVHLWHPPQPGKRWIRGLGRTTADLSEKRRSIPPEVRIDELRRREFGNPKCPDPPFNNSTEVVQG